MNQKFISNLKLNYIIIIWWRNHLNVVLESFNLNFWIHYDRIVPVLTLNFVKSDECLEMFNMAICCTRRKGKDFLVPLYFETIQIIPVSISLVQFLDCRLEVILISRYLQMYTVDSW